MRVPQGILRRTRLSPLRLGIIFVVFALLAGVVLFQKGRISTYLDPGEVITVEFSQAYRLRDFVSDAKIAGIPVGVVSSTTRNENGITEVKAKVDDDAMEKLGTAPSAAIRPTTMLGGNYYLDLKPGGRPGTFNGSIPVERTKVPVELDKLTAAFQPDARAGVRSSIRDLDATLRKGGSDALTDLTRSAPKALGPAADVFEGLRGNKPRTDLTNLVRSLESTSRELSEQHGQLDGIVTDVQQLSTVLAGRGDDIAGTLAGMPATLNSTDTALQRLDVTLDKVGDTAQVSRPAVDELDTLLERADPVLGEARPVVNDLRKVLVDARPLVHDLVPTSKKVTSTLEDVRGPVLDRVNGPILKTINSPYQGTGKYQGTGADRPFYQELGFMAANLANATMVDENGAMISYLAGVGPGSLAGLPISLEQMFRRLAGQQEGPR